MKPPSDVRRFPPEAGFSSRRRRAFLTLLVTLTAGWVCAQQVHVFDDPLETAGSTPEKLIKPDPGEYQILLIPVVTAAAPFDPGNNLLNTYDPDAPNLRQDLIDRMAEVADFWDEASYGQISLTATVLDRYYQMPLEAEDYYRPDYVAAGIIGRPVISPPAEVPGGDLVLRLQLADAPETTLPLTLNAANSPYTHAGLTDALRAQVDPDVLELEVSADNRLRVFVAQRHVDEGVFVHVDMGQSDADVVAALGLDEGGASDALVIAQSVGVTFPLTVSADEQVGIQLVFESGMTREFIWLVPGGSTFNSAAAFVAAHGSDLPDATVSVAGNELRFDLAFDPAETVVGVNFDAKAPGLVSVTAKWGFEDALWGLDQVLVTDGVVTHAKRNTLKVNARLVLGQAMAAYLLNELTRPPGGGADPIPNTPIVAANEAQLDATFADVLGDYHAVVAVFLDITGKRAQAFGGSMDIGIQNGGYLYTYQTYSDGQVVFGSTGAGTLAHETGHSIGFPDLYNNSSGNYDPELNYPNDYDIMNRSVLHHPGAWAKTVKSDWVLDDVGGMDLFPEPQQPGAETRRYVISPLEYSTASYDSQLGGVPGDRELVKTVRLPLGHGDAGNDHYLLLQNRQAGPLFSQGLPLAPGHTDPGGVYLTDCISTKTYNYFEITTRNYVHPLTDRALIAGDNVTPLLPLPPIDAVDLTAAYPAYAGLDIQIVGELTGPGGARSFLVDVTREQSDFLDLRIAPWGAPPWESPDIWIEHGDKASLSEVPLEGNGDDTRWSGDYDPQANDGQPLNWIRVRVTNDGTIEAREVQVRLQLNQPGGMGDTGTWEEFPLSDPQDIGPGGEAIFNFPWNPTVGAHTCLKAEVFRWEADLGDLTPGNNGTQENVVTFQPTSSSPWNPTDFQVEVFNPFDHSLDIHVVPENVPYGMWVRVEESFFTLPARSSTLRKATLRIDDSVYLTPQPDGSGGLFFPYNDPQIGTIVPQDRFVAQFHLAGFAAPDGDYDVPIGGVTYNVFPTTTTSLSAAATLGGCDALVVVGSTTPPAGNETLEVEVRYPSGRTEWIRFETAANGTFMTSFPPKEGGNLHLRVRYPPGGLFAPTEAPPFMVFNPWLNVEAAAVPAAGGTVEGAGCFSAGATTTLTAVPRAGFEFAGWWDKRTGKEVSLNNSVRVTVDTNVSYLATFEPDPRSAAPDLAVLRFEAPAQANARAVLTGQVTLRFANHGSADVTAPFQVALYLSLDENITRDDLLLLRAPHAIRSLAQGASTILPRNTPIQLPDVPSGRYFLGAVLDGDGSIQELDERNNAAFLPLTITRGQTYEEWLAANRFKAGRPEEDDDANGLVNFGEYYFNQDPLDPKDTGNLPQIIATDDGLELRLTRLRSSDGVRGVLQLTTALGIRTTWREAIEDRDYHLLARRPDGAEEEVRYRLAPRQRQATFYRFVVRPSL